MSKEIVVQKNRFISLDLLRGVAAIGVIFYHAMPHSRVTDPLQCLVDFFFVLSGFVLEPIYPRSYKDFNNTKRFLSKRVLRFWPMVTCAITVRLIRTSLIGHNVQYGSNNIVLAYLLLQIFSADAVRVLVPLWSLSAEWVVNVSSVPFIAMRKYWHILCFVLFGYLMIFVYLKNYDPNSIVNRNYVVLPISGFGGLGRAIVGFGIGLAIRMIHNGYQKKSETSFGNTLLIIACAVLLLVVIMNRFDNYVLLVAPLCFAPIVYLVANFNFMRADTFWYRFAVLMGNLSFGIYVWHLVFVNPFGGHKLSASPIIEGVIEFSVMLTLAVIATRLTQKYVERPIQGYFKRRQMSATLPESSR